MRSSEPIPGDPWPHDMVITVDDQPNNLLELLWIREAHGLRPRGENLPPLLSDTPRAVRESTADREAHDEWEDAWPRLWGAALAHAGRDADPRLFDELRATADGSTQRAELLGRLVGPSWRDEFGDSALADQSYSDWFRRLTDAHTENMPARLEDHPERRDLSALIPAWRAGLTKIVTIPCTGDFTRRVGESALLVTARTREDSDSYRRALGSFV